MNLGSRNGLLLIALGLWCVTGGAAALSAEPLPWCRDKCDDLFKTFPDKPKCDLYYDEHDVKNGRIVPVKKLDRACKREIDAWERRTRDLTRARVALMSEEGCLDWCHTVSVLRNGEPLGEINENLWDILIDVNVCSAGEVDPYELSMVPMKITCSGMAFVPAGKFMMGCNEAIEKHCRDRESPLHVVYLDGYFVDKHEVTMSAYRRCVEAGACTKPVPNSELRYYNWGYELRDNHPVNGVTWYQARDYCSWAGKRLCTEAEWEKAARGTDGRLYPWGNDAPNDDYAVIDSGMDYSEDSKPWPVLSSSETVCSHELGNSPYGLCDMAGNVWEWTGDWFEEYYYKKTPLANPRGPADGDYKTIRGGRYYRVGFYLRSSARSFFRPGSEFVYLGFRCCKTP